MRRVLLPIFFFWALVTQNAIDNSAIDRAQLLIAPAHYKVVKIADPIELNDDQDWVYSSPQWFESSAVESPLKSVPYSPILWNEASCPGQRALFRRYVVLRI
jgi:hypothetical protein